MKQRYEIPLPLDEVKERLRADMQTDWPLGKLLRSVKRPANDRRGLYGQIEGERLWAVMMRGYDMYPKRVFFGTLRAQGDHTILEGGFSLSDAGAAEASSSLGVDFVRYHPYRCVYCACTPLRSCAVRAFLCAADRAGALD